MWERSGGNAKMVDTLVAMWNEKNPDRKINLTYIPHAEMVPKLAQAIASGEVPDLMGMDLIYGAAVRGGRPARRHHRQDQGLARAEDRQPGPHDGRDLRGRLYGVPLYADVSALFYNKDLFQKAGLDPNKPPTSLAEIREYADKITALGGDVKGYFLPGSCAGCNIFTVGPLMWASRRQDRAEGAGDEPLVGDGVKQVLQWARDMIKAGNVHEDARAENRRDLPPAVRLRQGRHDGHRQLQHPARQGPEPGHELRHRAAAGRGARLRSPRSSAATSWSSRRAASASTTPSTS